MHCLNAPMVALSPFSLKRVMDSLCNNGIVIHVLLDLTYLRLRNTRHVSLNHHGIRVGRRVSIDDAMVPLLSDCSLQQNVVSQGLVRIGLRGAKEWPNSSYFDRYNVVPVAILQWLLHLATAPRSSAKREDILSDGRMPLR